VPLPRHNFDAEYVRRLVAGDPDTELHFTRYFGELLVMKLRSRLRSPAQVEDARQETFVRVLSTLKQKGGLASAESLGAFVNGVCNNILFEMYRANARTTELDEEYDEIALNPSGDATLIAGEERDDVQRALNELPPREQQLLRWLFFEERDKDDICRELQIDRGYLRVLLHRAKNHFKERFVSLASR
jgi:RNA polymerase sigma-70 factor (ECF subfamily)